MKALIIANGALPSRRLVRRLASAADIVICADGGANKTRPMRITPDFIIGDMDSITPSTKKYFHRIPSMFVEDQDSTDLEKAIQLCIDMMCTSVNVVGGRGTGSTTRRARWAASGSSGKKSGCNCSIPWARFL